MDATGLPAAEVARRLGTSLPRVKRAIDRDGVQVQRGPGGRVRIDGRAFRQLRQALGQRARVGELSVAQAAVLAALARAPLGLVSARAVATRAGVSPTAASRAVAVLLEQRLVSRERTRIAGRAREVQLVSAAVTGRRWQQLAPALAHIEPAKRSRPRDKQVPARLRHLFWNTAESQLGTERAGGYIARRLLQTADPQGLAWGAEQLSAGDWEHAATTRGIDQRSRSLARNLAAAARERA